MTSPQLPRFSHHTTDKPMPYPIWSQSARRKRREQFIGDFLAGIFFAMVFAIIVHLGTGR
jgi:hypothetical protein